MCGAGKSGLLLLELCEVWPQYRAASACDAHNKPAYACECVVEVCGSVSRRDCVYVLMGRKYFTTVWPAVLLRWLLLSVCISAE